MKLISSTILSIGVLTLVGCGKESTSTAPPKTDTQAPGEKPGPTRKLTVKAPGNQSVVMDQTTEFTVSVDRDHFAGDIGIELRDLPKGVTLETKETTIPAGKDSVKLTVKAAPDAPAVEHHVVKVAAKAKEMPEAVSDFKLDVKPKK
jgi:hypothetical protein